MALLANATCGHIACVACWATCTARQLLQHTQTCLDDARPVPDDILCCGGEGCTKSISWGLLRGICIDYSEAVRSQVAVLDATLRAQDRRQYCEACGRRAYIFREHPCCGHVACEDCWFHAAEAEIASGIPGMIQVSCLAPMCGNPISGGLRRRLCQISEVVSRFYLENRAEHIVLDAVVAQHVKVVWPGGKALFCEECSQPVWGLLQNQCGHKACWRCWIINLEGLSATCLSERRTSMPCFHLSCDVEVQANLWRFLCDRSSALQLKKHDAELKFQMGRLRQLERDGVQLARALTPTASGPTCIICREPQWALLTNAPCGHGACEHCWAAWAATQIDRCDAERQDVGRCFALGCDVRVEVPLERHLEKTSQPLRAFGARPEVRERRRLRCNPIYPAHMQQNCPRSGCWGLGYLGFDMIMCFMCEHTWSPENGGEPIPVDNDVEEIMGVRVKKCPNCDEYIEKNGGCDHMTCRCKHQFWWSTLAPYS